MRKLLFNLWFYLDILWEFKHRVLQSCRICDYIRLKARFFVSSIYQFSMLITTTTPPTTDKNVIISRCGLRSPSIESSGVLYISPTHTSSMQELIMQGLQQKLEKSCFRCNKNTWHVESNHILQPPNYLIIVVNRFRYINNQFAKDKCSIPMDMTVVLGYHKFSLQATIDHHGPSIYSGHYTTSVNCCNRTFYCNDNKITEFDMINTKNSSTAYVVIYKLIT